MVRIRFVRVTRTLALILLATLCAFASVGAFGQRVAPRASSDKTPPAPLDPFTLRARTDATQERMTEAASERNLPTSPSPSSTNAGSSDARDRIVLKDGRTIEGRIVALSGREGASFETKDSTSRVALVDVDYIEAAVGESFARGLALFDRARTSGAASLYRGALACFQDARRSSPRRFEREWATARIVDCLQALGRSEDAVVEFFLLCRLDSHSAYLASIPLRWLNQSASSTVAVGNAERSIEDVAAEWLGATDNPTKRANPSGRLLAASVLLNSNRYGRDAVDALRALATLESADASNRDEVETCRAISLLASAQLWRQRLLASPTADEIERWRRAIVLLPNDFQAGPTALVAQGEQRLGAVEAAARDFLFVATLSLDGRLARSSANAAARLTADSGRAEEARRILRRWGLEDSTARSTSRE